MADEPNVITYYRPLKQHSRIWLDCSTNVHLFTCHAKQFDGWGSHTLAGSSGDPGAGTAHTGSGATNTAMQTTLRPYDIEVYVRIPVEKLDTGNPVQNKDLRNALDARRHPEITYRLYDGEFGERRADEEAEWYVYHTRGELRISGEAVPIEMPVHARRMDENRIRIKGSKTLNMNDFDVEPPVVFMGLVRVHEEIIVNFDLLVESDGEMVNSEGPVDSDGN